MDFRPRKATRKIILHDSHTQYDLKPDTTAHLRTRGRTMGLLEVGYHFVIERDGRVMETRPHRAMGAHCMGQNHDSIGVCLAGGLCGVDDFTQDQMESATTLVLFLLDHYGDLAVFGHSEVARGRYRDCPCPAFDMDAFRKDYMQISAKPRLKEPVGVDGLSEQNRVVLEYLRSGRSLTSLIALTQLGVGSISSRIAELRKLKGPGGKPLHDIESAEARDFHGRRYVKYRLADHVAAA